MYDTISGYEAPPSSLLERSFRSASTSCPQFSQDREYQILVMGRQEKLFVIFHLFEEFRASSTLKYL